MRKDALNIFLDTQVFDACNYNFNTRDFSRLRRLIDDGCARLFLTTITRGEIESHIKVKAGEAFTALKEFRRHAAVAAGIIGPYDAIFKITKKELVKSFLERFSAFCSEMEVETISISDVLPELIFDDYFMGNPPFGTGKKKDEFPDAFAAAAIQNWCARHSEEMIVVSGDNDWAKRCEEGGYMTHKSRLDEVLSLFADQELALDILSGVRSSLDDIISLIESKFPTYNFYLIGLEGEVEEVEFLEFELESLFLAEAEDGKAVIKIDCFISYDAQASFLNPSIHHSNNSNPLYDSDRILSVRLGQGAFITCEAEVEYEIAEPKKISIRSANLPMDEYLGVDCSSAL